MSHAPDDLLGEDGLVFSNSTTVASAYATIGGSFSVGELTFAANSLTLAYSHGGNYPDSGSAGSPSSKPSA